MSIGDVKGFRRRLKRLAQLGHTPRKPGRSAAELIERNRAIAARSAKAAKKK